MKKLKTRISLERKDVRKIEESLAWMIGMIDAIDQKYLHENYEENHPIFKQALKYQHEFTDWLHPNGCMSSK